MAQRDPLNNKRRYIQYNHYIALLKANPLYVSIIFNSLTTIGEIEKEIFFSKLRREKQEETITELEATG